MVDLWYNIYSKRKVVTIMTREERIERAIKGQQLLTYAEWYEINKLAFEWCRNSLNPEKLYEEYVNETLGE
jgi:hypothetical protein